jgi:hypothetical protein
MDDIEDAAQWLGTWRHFYAWSNGGYPDIVTRVESHIVEAGLDHDGEPALEVYCAPTVLAWKAAVEADGVDTPPVDGTEYDHVEEIEAGLEVFLEHAPDDPTCRCDVPAVE